MEKLRNIAKNGTDNNDLIKVYHSTSDLSILKFLTLNPHTPINILQELLLLNNDFLFSGIIENKNTPLYFYEYILYYGGMKNKITIAEKEKIPENILLKGLHYDNNLISSIIKRKNLGEDILWEIIKINAALDQTEKVSFNEILEQENINAEMLEYISLLNFDRINIRIADHPKTSATTLFRLAESSRAGIAKKAVNNKNYKIEKYIEEFTKN